MTTIHHSPPSGVTPFAIFEDADEQAPPSPSEVYEGDASFHPELSIPDNDDIIASIENNDEADDGPAPYRSSYTARPSNPSASSQSRRVSAITTASFISSLPSDISVSSKPIPDANNIDSRYSPRKERPPFRNPDSVRAMQMSSPPPLPAYDAPRDRLKGNYKLATPSRASRSDTVSTTGSRRRRAQRDSVHSEYQVLQSPRGTPTPQQSLPLVLLHVTILPIQFPYAHDFMIKAMPEWLVEHHRVLREKLQDIVLMNRGILISHPRDEYDVLEERILESLELKTPRLLKCGHFVGPDADANEDEIDELDEGSVTDGGTGRGSRMSGGTVTAEEEAEWKYNTPDLDDASVCTDCHRQVKRPGQGVGRGLKRWDVKIYAANGLMRAGAWSAAWSEMERCDVEISPWIPDDLRKTLDRRMQEEQEAAQRKLMYAAELERQIAEETAMQKKLEAEAQTKRKAEELEMQTRIQVEAAILQQKLNEEAAAKIRLEETLDEKIEEAKETIRLDFEAQALAEARSIAERIRAMEEALQREQEKTTIQASPAHVHSVQHDARSRSRGRPRTVSRRLRANEVAISTLLKNYLLLQLQDSRNYLIVILGALVIYLATNANHSWLATNTHWNALSGDASGPIIDVVPSVVITYTATSTATSVSTLTITESELVERTREALPPACSTGTAVEAGLETSRLSTDPPLPNEQVATHSVASATSEDFSEAVDSLTPIPSPDISEESSNPVSSFMASAVTNETGTESHADELESVLNEPAMSEPTSPAAKRLDAIPFQDSRPSVEQEQCKAHLATRGKDEL